MPRRLWILLALLLVGCAIQPDQTGQAAGGALDLTEWSPAEGRIALDGEWDLYWGELLTPAQIDAGGAAPTAVAVPGGWNDAIPGTTQGAGVATYALRVQLPGTREALALRVGAPSTAYRLWIDGVERGGAGAVGLTEETASPVMEGRTYLLEPGGDAIELVVQVANFGHRAGGLRRPWVLGHWDELQRAEQLRALRDGAYGVTMALVGLFFLGFFAMRRQDRTKLYFAMTALLVGTRAIPASRSDLAALIAPGAPWELLITWEYLATYLAVACGLLLLGARYPGAVPRPVLRGLQVACLTFGVVVLVTPPEIFTRTLVIMQILAALGLATMGWGLLQASRQELRFARAELASIVLLFAAVVHDALETQELIHTNLELFTAVLLLFLLIESYALMREFSDSYNMIEWLSEDLRVANRDLRATNEAAQRFVPSDFLEMLEKGSILEIERGDHVQTRMGVLFCDIRGFTPLIESLQPHEAFSFINTYLRAMEPAIHRHDGFINQYLGDAIMALFPQGGGAAIRAGVDMLRALEGFNAERAEAGLAPIRIGIGVNVGPLMLGTIGGMERLDSGVIGDDVNLAARVEGMTKLYGAPMIASGSAVQALGGGLPGLRELDRVVAKGKSEPVQIFEIYAGLSEAERAAREAIAGRFAEALALYRAGSFAAAGAIFATCPDDPASRLYVARCERLAREGAPAGWRGDTVLEVK